jgi:hypothetical protein
MCRYVDMDNVTLSVAWRVGIIMDEPREADIFTARVRPEDFIYHISTRDRRDGRGNGFSERCRSAKPQISSYVHLPKVGNNELIVVHASPLSVWCNHVLRTVQYVHFLPPAYGGESL